MTTTASHTDSTARKFRRLLLAAGLGLTAQTTLAAPTLTVTTSLDTASSAVDGRDYLDIGGVWDGSSDISTSSGDVMVFSVANGTSPNQFATDIAISFTLPAGVRYFNDSASVSLNGAGCIATAPTVDDGVGADQVGGTINLTLTGPGGGDYDLRTNCELTLRYEVMALSAATTGINTVRYEYPHEALGAPVTPSPSDFRFNINAGAKVLSFDDLNPSAAVNQIVPWQLSVTNTGSGGLFDVELDVSNANPGVSLQLLDIVQVATGVPTAQGFIKATNSTSCQLGPAGALPPCDALRVPYLPAQEVFSTDLNALVTGCEDIDLRAVSTDRERPSTNLTAQVTLDLEQPLIAFNAPATTFPFTGAQTVSVPINSTGLGDARGLSIATNINAQGLRVTNVITADWSETNGVFTYTAGDFPSGGATNLQFEIEADNVCLAPNGGRVTWEPAYTNVCGNPFIAPTRFANITGPSNEPSLAISQTLENAADGDRLDLGQNATFRITLSGDNVDLVGTDPIVITDTLPSNITSVGSITLPVNVNSSVSCPGGSCDPGEVLTWTINPNAAPVWTGGDVILNIPITATTDACEGGNTVTNTVTLPGTQSVGPACSIDGDTDSFTAFMGNSPNVNNVIEFDPLAPASGTAFETGALNADCVPSDGEGECITFRASYGFDPGYAGIWTGSVYSDNFGGQSDVSYVPNTLRLSVDGGLNYTAIADAAGCLATNPAPSSQRIRIDLGCAIVTQLGQDNPVSGDDIAIEYKITVGNGVLGSAATASYSPRSLLLLKDGAMGVGACDTGGDATFTLPTSTTVARAAAQIQVQNVPEQLGVCEIVPARLNVSNIDNGTAETSRDHFVQLLTTGDYEFVSTTAPTYSGVFLNNIDALLAAVGGPTFEFDIGSNDSYDEEIGLGQNGIIDLQLRRKAGTPSGFNQTAVEARLDYDDNFTVVPFGPSRGFTTTGSQAPVLVTEGDLSITTSPQVVTVTADTARWIAYVTNGGNGPAIDVQFDNTLPTNVVLNAAATNTANAAICNNTPRSVTATDIGGGKVRFDVGDMAAGETCQVAIATTIDPAANCNIPDRSNLMEARWGCGGVLHQEPSPGLSADNDPLKDDSPNFLFLDGDLVVNHLAVPPLESFANLCDDTGNVVVEVRNTGGSSVFNTELVENIGANSGLTFVPGSVEVSVNGGAFTPAADPSLTGANSNILTWNNIQIASLGRLYPRATATGGGDPSRPNFIRVRYRVSTNGEPFFNAPILNGTAEGERACGGAPVQSATNSFTLQVRKPELRVEKVGRNVTQGSAFGENVSASVGDTVEWQIDVFNDGDYLAQNIRVQDILPNLGGTAAGTISGGGLANEAITDSSVVASTDIDAANSERFLIQQAVPAALASCVNRINTFKATFGCEAPPNPGPHSDLPSAAGVTDTASLFLAPNFDDAGSKTQTVRALPGGRMELVVTYTNTGSDATLTEFTDTLPSSGGSPLYEVDSTSNATYELAGGAPQIMNNTGSASVPVYALSNLPLVQGQSIIFRLPLLQTRLFDTGVNPQRAQELNNNIEDPRRIDLNGTNQAILRYTDNCGDAGQSSLSSQFSAIVADLEVSVAPDRIGVKDGETRSFTFTIRNLGTTTSIADDFTFSFPGNSIGAGWIVNSVTVTGSANGANGACANTAPYTCSAAQLGTLTAGASQSATVVVNATVDKGAGPLTMRGQVEGNYRRADGTDTGNNYSLDQIRALVFGFDFSKVIQTTSVDGDVNPNLHIGESITYRLNAELFGLDFSNGDSFENITITDTLPEHLIFISQTQTADNDVTFENAPVFSVAPNPAGPGQVITWELSDINAANPVARFNTDVVSQAANNATTQALDVSGVGLPQTQQYVVAYDVVENGTAPTSFTPQLQHVQNIQRPLIQLDTQVRRLPGAVGDFVELAQGDAGDNFQFRIHVSNTGNAPAYDLNLVDLLQTAKLDIDSAAGSKGADTNAFPGDGVVDLQGGAISVPSNGQIVFNDTTLPGLPADGRFAKLNPGEELILLYEVRTNTNVNPDETLLDNATLFGSTVPGPQGEQDPTQPVEQLGEWVFELVDTAGVRIVEALVDKTILTTSEGSDTNTNVRIGEHVRYQIELLLPEGTTPAMRVLDQLPEGLRLVQATDDATESDVTFSVGTGISCDNQSPNISPAVQPSNGPQQLIWDFGDCTTAVASTPEQRTLRISYVAQVRNIPIVVDDTAANASPVDNAARLEMNSILQPIDTVDLSVQEAALNIQLSLDSTIGLQDAGGVARYRVAVTNNTDQPAYDLHLFVDLADQQTLLGNTTFDAANSTSTQIAGLTAPSTDINGSDISWGRLQTAGPQDLDLLPGERFEFTFETSLNNSIEPDKQIDVTASVDWTSLDDDGLELTTAPTRDAAGSVSGERTGGSEGSGNAANTYLASVTNSQLVSDDTIAIAGKVATNLSNPGQPFSIGDLVQYAITVNLQEGIINDLVISDLLPPGIAYQETLSINGQVAPYTGQAPFSYDINGELAAQGGINGQVFVDVTDPQNVSWRFGDVQDIEAPSADGISIVYLARVENDVTVFPESTLSFSAPITTSTNTLNYNDADGPGVSNGSTASSSIVVAQPRLDNFRKSVLTGNTVSADQAVQFEISFDNVGLAPAYNVRVQDLIPEELQGRLATTPGLPVQVDQVLIGGVDVTARYNQLGEYAYVDNGAGDDVFSFTLQDGDRIRAGQNVTIRYTVQTDSALGGGSTINTDALVSEFHSLASGHSNAANRRTYLDATLIDDEPLNTDGPQGIGKVVDKPEANVGETLSFTISVPNSAAPVQLFDVVISDDLPADLEILSISDATGNCNNFSSTGSAGQSVQVSCDTITAGTQAQILVTARIDDVAANNATVPTLFQNSASYVYAKTDGAAKEPSVSTPTPTATVVTEPEVTVTMSSPVLSATPASQGDTATYTVTVTNPASASGTVYDLVLTNTSDNNLFLVSNPAALPAPTGTGGVGGGNGGTYIWATDIDLAPGQSFSFDATYEIAAGAPNFGDITNDIRVDGASNEDPNPDTRAYSDDAAQVVFQTGGNSLSKVVAGPISQFTPGDEFSYTLTFSSDTGNLNAVSITDVLPRGLIYLGASNAPDFQFINLQRAGGGIIVPSFPNSDIEASAPNSEILFDFGDIESQGGPNRPQITATVNVRVADNEATTGGATLTNTSRASFDDGTGPATLNSGGADITVVEPRLVVSISGPPTIEQGTPVQQVLDVENAGGSAAYDSTVILELPVGLRETAPANLVLNVFTDNTATNLARGPLVDGVDFTSSYDSNTGRLTLLFPDSSPNAVFADGEMLRATYNVQLDSGFDADATVLTSRAVATQWANQPQAAPLRRVATRVFGAGTDPSGDDFQAATPMTASTPVISFLKSVVNQSTGQNPGDNATPGDTLRFTLSIENTGSLAAVADLTDVFDDLQTSPAFEAGTLSMVSSPASGTNNSDPNGGADGTGVLQFTGITVAPNTTETVVVDIGLRNSIANGTIVRNQGSLAVPGFPPIPSDDLNNPGGTGSENPTRTQLGSAPAMEAEKTSRDLTGDANELVGGDTLRYTIVIRNVGDEPSVNTRFFDNVPGNTTYVPSSTTLNGVTVPDVGGASPLTQPGGLLIQSDDAATSIPASGVVNNQLGGVTVATVSFDVVVNSGLLDGTVILNQGTVMGEGAGSGPYTPVPTDDPTTADGPDPTIDFVGNAPFVDATKVAEYTAPLAVNDLFTYVVSLTNLGNEPANNVVLSDLVDPALLTFEAGTLSYDDGSGFAPLTDAGGDDAGDFGQTTANTVTVNVGTMQPGDTVQLRYQVRPQVTGDIITQGVVTADGLPDEPTDLDGNDTNGDQPTPVFVGAAPVLSIEKNVTDANGGEVESGDFLDYVIRVENRGGAAANPLTVTDTVDTSVMQFVSGTLYVNGSLVTDNALGDDAGDFNLTAANTVTVETPAATPLSPGSTLEVRFRTEVNAGLSQGTSILNTAVANTPGSPGPVDDDANIDIGGANGVANLSGSVWVDEDHDDIFDPSEPPAENWAVTVRRNGAIVATTTTDVNGNYEFLGLTPGAGYEVLFSLSGSTAPLGRTNPTRGTPGNLIITDIDLAPGDNVVDENLPIDPSGVVYDSVSRQPVPGASLRLLRIDTGVDTPVSDACLGGLGAQGQTTGANGAYAFFLLPGTDATCPDIPTATYRIEVTPPSGYNGGSTLITPTPGPFDVIGGCPADAVPSTPDCEIQAQFGPPNGAAPTTFYLDFNIDSSSPNVFNNHIAIDPLLNNLLSLTKTASLLNVTKAQLVPYTIVARNNQGFALNNFEIRDTFPAGFKYVEGSALIDDVATEPTVNGRVLTWSGLDLASNAELEIKLLLVVGAGVSEAEYVNIAQAFDTAGGSPLSGVASAAVRVVPDPLFDCTDIIGQVFDDENRNGYQDQGEVGLPAVRIATVNGLLVTTDQYGRYHITCADVPNADRGSNYILKLDERTLPSGYRMTTENPRVKRVTRGKMSKFNFGASIHRVVRLDLGGSVFDASSRRLRDSMMPQMEAMLESLKGEASILRLSYLGRNESPELVDARLDWVRRWVEKRWSEMDCCYELVIETETFWRDGRPPARGTGVVEVRP